MTQPLYDQHAKTLDQAIEAIRGRGFFSAYPEMPSGKIYGETARADGLAAFKSLCDTPFELNQPTTGQRIGDETSPYGFALGITYPAVETDALITAAATAQDGWKQSSIEARAGVLLEALARLNARSFEIGFAVMHTTGQGSMMAFQAGGPHAQDRGLEALAYAVDEMRRTPATATWQKRVGREETVTLEKTYRIVPRGVAVAIGCSTFPTWNTYPGLWASLATGNAVIVKPHPGAILPLAITVAVLRDVLSEAGFDPNVVTLAADTPEAPMAGELVTDPRVGIVDYTGGSEFGSWIEREAQQAVVYTEKAGINSVVIDSFDNLRAVTGNLAFGLCLYSGQMCTTSQNIYIPRDGVTVDGATMSFDEVGQAIVKAVDWLLSDPKRGAEILGAIQSAATLDRVEQAESDAKAGQTHVMRVPTPVENESFPDVRGSSPLMVAVDANDTGVYQREMFGPIVYLVATENTAHSIALAATGAKEHGGLTAAVYSTDESVIDHAVEELTDAGVSVSCNLVGSIWVNQSAAFSDFHVSGANPAGNATLCDAAFVVGRYNIVQSRVAIQE